MKNLTRLNAARATTRVRLLVPAAAVIALGGVVAGPVTAAPAAGRGKPSYPPKAAKFKQPQVKHGVLTINGTNAGEKITIRLKAGDSGIIEVDVGDDGSADFSVERSDVAKIAVNARGGNDAVRIDEANGAFTDTIATTIDGGNGNDTIAGGKGIETLVGGRGNDSIDGNGGNDLGLLGSGNDTFVWDPGDGSDTVEGQAGADTMLFNGAGAAEQVTVSANGRRLTFFRNPGNITMDTAGVERVDFNALGGADAVTVNDLTGTGVKRVIIDLAATLGGATGDGQADRVVVNGTNGNDTIDVSGDAAAAKVSGLAATTEILHSEVANDRLEVNTLGGSDAVSAVGLAPGTTQLFVDGLLIV
jgi:Ca2+-binding RTX toxin-like protein